jgi:hypothetical protein
MKIIIDTNVLSEYKLTPNEYVLLYTYYHINILAMDNEDDINSLVEKGYLQDSLLLSDKTKRLFNDKDVTWEAKFKEFWKLYPSKAGNRILKTESFDTHQAIACRKRFMKSCYNDIENADKLISGLKNQINLLQGTRDFDYFQLVESWLNQGTWEKYLTVTKQTVRERTEGIN